MSLKEEVDYIKKEISTEESFIENFFKVEKFYKKYKKVLFGTVGVVIVAVIGISVSTYMSEQTKLKANIAFNEILKNPNDTNALSVLKSSNKKLYDIALYMQDKKKATNIEFLKELTIYSAAMKNNSSDEISNATQNQKFILKDFAIFNKALIQAKNGKYQDAKESLKLIPVSSEVSSLVNLLKHFLLVK